jgi:hypothetical protein
MKFFLLITIFSIFMLSFLETHPEKAKSFRPDLPLIVEELRPSFDRSFKEGMHARLLWSLLTGEKRIVSPSFSRSMNNLQLGFLLSFTSIQLSILLWGILKATKKFYVRACLIALTFLLPYLSLKRLAILRMLNLLKWKFKFYIRDEWIFLATFFISYLLGHFTLAPLSFILSFLFIGGFIATKTYSRKEFIFCLLSTQMIIAMYFHKSYFLLSILTTLLLIPLTTLLMALGYFYLFTYKWIEFNWIENLVNGYLLIIKMASKLISFSEITPSFAWLFLIWMILLRVRARYFLPLSIVSIAANVCW